MISDKQKPTPKLSVHMITYNHENYITKSLDQALLQETEFPYEIVIGDDCSTDKTRSLVKYYANKYPNLIHALLPEKNMGKNGENNFIATLGACQGEYIAFLEGDDYWTNINKLQIQVNFLDKNPDFVGCFHNSIVVDKQDRITDEEWFKDTKQYSVKESRQFNQHDCLRYLGSSYPSCSLMIRRSAVQHLPYWYLKSPTDYATDILITEYGDLAYLPLNMGAYRIHPGGIWQGQTELQKNIEIFYRYKLISKDKALGKKYADDLNLMMKWKILKIGELARADQTKLSLRLLSDFFFSTGLEYHFNRTLMSQLRIRVNPIIKPIYSL